MMQEDKIKPGTTQCEGCVHVVEIRGESMFCIMSHNRSRAARERKVWYILGERRTAVSKQVAEGLSQDTVITLCFITNTQ